MPYGLKYYAEYKSRDTTLYRLEIRDKALNDDLSAVAVRLKDQPILDWEEKPQRTSLAGKLLQFSLWNTKAQGHFFYESLFAGPETSSRVDFYEDGIHVYRGFIIPELYEDSYEPLPKPIRVQAADRIGKNILNNYRFTEDIEDGTTSLAEVIDSIIQLTEAGLNWSYGAGWFPQGVTAGPTDGALSLTYIYNDSLRDNNDEYLRAGEILEKVLETFQLVIFQDVVDGELRWFIDWVAERTTNRQIDHYTLGSPAVPASKATNVVTPTFTLLTEKGVLRNKAIVSRTNGYKRVGVRRDVMRFNNLINLRPLYETNPNSVPDIPSGALPNPPSRGWLKHIGVERDVANAPAPIASVGNNTSYPDFDDAYNTIAEQDGMFTKFFVEYDGSDGYILTVEIDASWSIGMYFSNISTRLPYTCLDRDNIFAISIRILYDSGAELGYIVYDTPNDPESGYRLRSGAENTWLFKQWQFPSGQDYSVLENRQNKMAWNIDLSDGILPSAGDYQIIIGLIPAAVKQQGGGNPYVMPPYNEVNNYNSFNYWYIQRYAVTLVNEQDWPNEAWAELNSDYTMEKQWNIRWFKANYNYKNLLMDSQGKEIDEWDSGHLGTFPVPGYIDLLSIDYYAQFYHQPRWKISNAIIRSSTIPRLWSRVTDPYTGIDYYIVSLKSVTADGEHEVSLLELVQRDE